ncbi:hypothetical protein JTI58_19870 [Lysinibacillus fusiformis]|uniref:hypothetical protein n=1 Tax=Lysinibacillus TaxID=400634 RepID=UPI0019678FA9|nr:hypothetical protein [Lysinibacillus fusiformis]QSB09240.1 hypothetical protein JTI58_19870 [Lysinibacillus fusiformis]
MNGDQHDKFHANANITHAEMVAVSANFKQLSIEKGFGLHSRIQKATRHSGSLKQIAL